MFGLFESSKKSEKPRINPEEIARSLFTQITAARDAAREGGIVDEKVFNDRLNTMYVAGYLVGYVDEQLSSLEADDIQTRHELARGVFETMFPGVGMDFIKQKVVQRQRAMELSGEDEEYQRVAGQCHAFDTAMADAEQEAEQTRQDADYQPGKLKEYLLLGEYHEAPVTYEER